MDEQEIDIRTVLGILRRQLRLIIITIVLVLVAATAVLFALKPVYSASTLILVDPSRKDLLDPEAKFYSPSSDSDRVDSEVQLVLSETTLIDVVQSQKLIDNAEYGVKLGLRDSLLSVLRIAQPTLPTGAEALQGVLTNLRNAVSVQRLGLTYLISVDVRSTDPQNAATLANAIADAYIKDQLKGKIDSTLAARDIIQARIQDASLAVVNSEQALDAYISDNAASIASQTGRTELLSMRQQIASLSADRARLVNNADVAEQSLGVKDWRSIAQTLQSDAFNKLVDQRNALQGQLANAQSGTPAAIDLEAQLTQLEASLADTASQEVSSIRQKIAQTQTSESDLRSKLRVSVLAGDLPAEVLTHIYELQQTAELARSQYQTLLTRLKNLETQAYLQIADSRVASLALPPSVPSFPNPRLIFAIAGFAALALGIGLAFLYENFIGGFTSIEQLESVLRVRAAAAIPRQKGTRKSADGTPLLSVADITVESPLSVFAESIRRVRVWVDQAYRRVQALRPNQKARGMIVMVTSASPGEGKTTTALALGRAYALSGKTTMIIDCDLRKPSIHHQLGLEPSAGLLEYLANKPGRPELAAILKPDRLTSARIAIGGRRSDIATDQLVTSSAFLRLIEASATSFDVVVLDTPPVGPVVDGLYLAQFADIIVFVVQWATTSQRDAKAALDSLAVAKHADTEILPVLNQEGDKRNSYHYKYSEYYTEG